MATFLIGYDLNKSGKNYDDLIKAIKQVGAWWHRLDSTWIVKSDKNCKEIRDHLNAYIDASDELLVVRLSGEGAWIGFDDNSSKWLKDNL